MLGGTIHAACAHLARSSFHVYAHTPRIKFADTFSVSSRPLLPQLHSAHNRRRQPDGTIVPWIEFKAPPPDQDYNWYKNYIEEQFPHEGPALFGLHNNAEIGFLLASADALFTIVVDLSGAGRSRT